MIKSSFFIIAAFLLTPAAYAADLGVPKLSPPLSQSRFFDADRFLTTGGVRYSAGGDLTLEPELGVGYRALERDLPGAVAESIHNVHAQAGWRISLPETLYLSAAAKLPVFSYESTGHSIGQDITSRQSYDFSRSLRGGLSWSGEMGIHLSPRADLTLYYDQSPTGGTLPRMYQLEERIGTRIIWRFK
ncbi:hypothetical protein [Geomesophilobacter sediminis]|uniref:hypothetical protein n=1 Tax=Geomesophilobacter sediminis TaxID=2798584 RepID=UPI001C07A980|nr:hypothetical protein [Geomesophilobacter sediminis]